MKQKGLILNTMPFLIVLAAAVTCIASDTEQVLSLSGHDWWIHDDSADIGESKRFYSADVPETGWIPAQVPGNIQADVEAAHRLRPLWYGGTDTNLYEVARKNWWYRKDFPIPASFDGRRLTLVFDGVDERCKVWLNGKPIGGNAGMFRRFEFDVTDAIMPGTTNQLAVWIARMPEELVPYIINSDGPGHKNPFGPFGFMTAINRTREVLKDLKNPGNFSYDWAFNIWTLGIWKEVRIEATGPARIDWTRVNTELTNDFSKATVTATLEVNSTIETSAAAQFRISGHGSNVSESVTASLKKGHNLIKAELPVSNPALWWPNGHGDQPLYMLEAKLKTAEGTISDARSVRFGIRDLQWVHTEGAPADYINRYQLVINGRKVRTIGTGLILPGVLPVQVSDHNLRLLHQAKACGMNTLRLNGGGGGGPLFDEHWYNLADELGIMIQWEFPIGNSTQGRPERDEMFLRNLEISCRSMIKVARNHPCIIEYGGGNEMEWDETSRHPALQVMRKVLVEETNGLFRATSADLGGKHAPWDFNILGGKTADRWRAMRGGHVASYPFYNSFLRSTKDRATEAMSYSEMGSCSPSHLEVWHRDVPLSSQWPINLNDPVLIRKNAVRSVFTAEHWLLKNRIETAFGPLDNLGELVTAGQYIGADGLRYIYDELRRRGKRMANITSHCYSEPHPNLAGSYLVDYAGRTLMNYDFLKQAISPISLSLRMDDCLYKRAIGIKAELSLVSDASQAARNLKWSWLARDRRGDVFARGEGIADIKPLEVKSLAALTVRPPEATVTGPFFMELRLEDAKGVLLTERIQVFGCRDITSPFEGLLNGDLVDTDDNAVSPDLETPESQANLAFTGNGATVTASSSRAEPYHKARGLIDGQYGNRSSWIGLTPKSWLQVSFREPATVGRVKLGRDRDGRYKDRQPNYIKIETSLDGQKWHTAFEKAGVTALEGFDPTKTILIQIAPIKAKLVKVTVDSSKSAEGVMACVDEIEIFAPTKKQLTQLPDVQFVPSWKRTKPVKRTTLVVQASSPRVEDGQEILDLQVRNTGSMTALFCEPHPLLVYRTDLYIENNNCFIPPGQTRTISIRASKQPQHGLSLAQTGWRLSTWNADDVQIEPNNEILLSVGRRDMMCREYKGYFDVSKVKSKARLVATGRIPDTSKIPYLLSDDNTVEFKFFCSSAQAARPARLRIHTADQSADLSTVVAIEINGCKKKAKLPTGLGIQRTDPAHLAFPASVDFDIDATDLRPGKNIIAVRVEGDGWFSWDALDLAKKEK